LPISNAYCDLGACGCVARVAPRTSSYSPRPRKTCDGSPGYDRRGSQWRHKPRTMAASPPPRRRSRSPKSRKMPPKAAVDAEPQGFSTKSKRSGPSQPIDFAARIRITWQYGTCGLLPLPCGHRLRGRARFNKMGLMRFWPSPAKTARRDSFSALVQRKERKSHSEPMSVLR
jgi:hypothetical protein